MIYVKIYYDFLDAIEPLGDAERGRLFTAILQYGRTGEAPQLNGNERFLFPMIRAQMDRDQAEYDGRTDEIRRIRSDAGKRGGAPIGNKNALSKTTKTSKNNQNQAKQTKDKDKDKDKDNSIKEAKASLCYAPVVSAWNSLPEPITKVYKIKPGSTRETMLKVRIRDFSLDSVLQAIENIRNSAFCRGVNNRGWVISFDWFLKPDNFQKVLEGNYNDRETKRTDNDRVRDELSEWLEEVKI